MRAVLLICLAVFALPVQAHEGRPIHIQLTQLEDNRFDLNWKIPPVLRPSEVPAFELVGALCNSTDAPSGLMGKQLIACDSTPSAVDIRFPEFNPALSILLEFNQLDGAQHKLFVGPEVRSIALPEEQSFGAVALQYLWAGFDHILEGFDHLLFVFCLLFVVGSFRRIFWAVTGFTLGHSLTLGLTALYGWSLPGEFVEPLIAFSIAMLAAEKLVADRSPANPKPLVMQYPALIASLFGLLHGFGFGGALAEIGLPYGYSLTALAFFNIGVELGQIAFIIAVLLIGKLAQLLLTIPDEQKALVARVFLYPAGILAGYWTVERVAGIII